MASPDDQRRGRDVAPSRIVLAKAKHGRVRDSRSPRERERRLIDRSEVLREAHSAITNRIRSYVNAVFGLYPRVDGLGYDFPMLTREDNPSQALENFEDRLRQAVNRLSKTSSLKKIADASKIPYSTLRRFVRLNDSISLENVHRLFSLPGFSEVMDELGSQGPVVIYDHTMEAMNRLQEIFDAQEIERVVYALESLARNIGKEQVPEALSMYANVLRRGVLARVSKKSTDGRKPKD